MKSSRNIKIIHPFTEEEWSAYYQLRYEILRKPWNQPENTTRDETENESIHWLMMDEHSTPIATGRLQINSPTEGQIRSMAVQTDKQNAGLGTLMIQAIEEEAICMNLSEIILDARKEAVPFYIKNGYVVIKDSYLLFNSIQHYQMSKKLNS